MSEKEALKDKLRAFLTFWESLVEVFGPWVPVKKQRAAIGRYRKIITIHEKDYASLEELAVKFGEYDGVHKKAHLIVIERGDNRLNMEVVNIMQRIDNLCDWLEWDHEAKIRGPDIYIVAKIRDIVLKETQIRKTTSSDMADSTIEHTSEDWKRFDRMHKQLKKVVKEDPKTDQDKWVINEWFKEARRRK